MPNHGLLYSNYHENRPPLFLRGLRVYRPGNIEVRASTCFMIRVPSGLDFSGNSFFLLSLELSGISDLSSF